MSLCTDHSDDYLRLMRISFVWTLGSTVQADGPTDFTVVVREDSLICHVCSSSSITVYDVFKVST